MSEQTPDTESGIADAQEPSMEDILASIRKIIAEDDIQTSAASEDTVAVVADIIPEAESVTGDVAELQPIETLDLDIITDDRQGTVELDVEALIGDKDPTCSDDIESVDLSNQDIADKSPEDALELEIPMDETEVLTLEDDALEFVSETDQADFDPVVEENPRTDLMAGAVAALGTGSVAGPVMADDVMTEAAESGEGDLSLMLDNMLEGSASHEEEHANLAEERVIDPAADLITQDVITEDVSDEDILAELDLVEDTLDTIPENDPDIDLVKSLMADLTEDSLHDGAEPPESKDAETEPDTVEASEPETVAETQVEAETKAEDVDSSFDIEDETLRLDDETEASSDDILDEILSITIDDEEKLLEDIAIADIEDVAHEETISLKDIAAAAKADAQAYKAGLPTSAVAGLGAAAIGGVVAVTQEDKAAEGEQSELDIDTIEMDSLENDEADSELSTLDDLLTEDILAEQDTLTPETLIEEALEMPRAKKADAIMDEVTETATAGAFASLNQVVEEKATVAERGDRIGDIVQEALRPMLKEWLDANLKGIVERAIAKEVKRISSGQ